MDLAIAKTSRRRDARPPRAGDRGAEDGIGASCTSRCSTEIRAGLDLELSDVRGRVTACCGTGTPACRESASTVQVAGTREKLVIKGS